MSITAPTARAAQVVMMERFIPDEPPVDEAPAYDFIPEGADEARDLDGSAPPAATPGLMDWDAGDHVDVPPPREWLLGNQFCRRFLSGLLAPGATGKTALRTLQYLSLA